MDECDTGTAFEHRLAGAGAGTRGGRQLRAASAAGAGAARTGHWGRDVAVAVCEQPIVVTEYVDCSGEGRGAGAVPYRPK